MYLRLGSFGLIYLDQDAVIQDHSDNGAINPLWLLIHRFFDAP